MGGWRKGDPFSHDLVSVGPASNPHALFLFPRRAVSVTGLAVLASLGHSGIPSHHAPPPPACGCLLLSERFHLCRSSLVVRGSNFCPSAYVSSRQHLAISRVLSDSVEGFFFFFFNTLFTLDKGVPCEQKVEKKHIYTTQHEGEMPEIQWDGKLLETNEIHSNPPRSHTHMNLYLPRLTRENIFDKQDHTVLGPPWAFMSP